MLSDKHLTKYTEMYDQVIKRYGLKLDDEWNKVFVPHLGSHPNEYHEYMIEQIMDIDAVAHGDKDIFLDMFDQLKQEVIDNPKMLNKDYWD